jgi:lipoprotein-releasing system permease protein
MINHLAFWVGMRYTRAKRRNHFISFISGVSMIGMTIGVMVLIIVLSVMNGFERELRERILGMVPHATVAGDGPLLDWQNHRQQLLEHEEVLGAAPYINIQGMLSSSHSNEGAMAVGVDPSLHDEVVVFDQHMQQGELSDLQAGDWTIILGSALAQRLRVGLGDSVNLLVPELTDVNLTGLKPRFRRFEVVGIFEVGAQLDGEMAIVHISQARKLLRMPVGSVEGIQIKLDDLFRAPWVVRELAYSLPVTIVYSDWTRSQGNLFDAIKMEQRIIGLLLFIIVAVAGFNIVSSLIMLVTEKQGDIAILRTMGATQRQIMAIFMVQGSTIGVVGVVLGSILGVIGALTIADIMAFIEQAFNFEVLSENVYFISYLPSDLRMENVWLIVAVSFTISILATLYPAWRASRVPPAEALRFE